MTSPPGSQNVSPARTTRSGSPSSSKIISPSITYPKAGPECRCGGAPGLPGGKVTRMVIASDGSGTGGGGAPAEAAVFGGGGPPGPGVAGGGGGGAAGKFSPLFSGG